MVTVTWNSRFTCVALDLALIKAGGGADKQKVKFGEKKVVVLAHDDDGSKPVVTRTSESFKSESLLVSKSLRSSCVSLFFVSHLFELFDDGKLLWNNGNNICLDVLLTRDEELQLKKRKAKAVVALHKKTSTRRYQRHTLSPSFCYSFFNS